MDPQKNLRMNNTKNCGLIGSIYYYWPKRSDDTLQILHQYIRSLYYCIQKTFWRLVYSRFLLWTRKFFLRINNTKNRGLIWGTASVDQNGSDDRRPIIVEYTSVPGICIRKTFRTCVFLILTMKSDIFPDFCFLLPPIALTAIINRLRPEWKRWQ